MSPADLNYLRTFGNERYNDFTKDADALPAFNRLAHAGYCRRGFSASGLRAGRCPPIIDILKGD